jgi:hypothetical protein
VRFLSSDVIIYGTDGPIFVGCGIGVLVRMFFVLTVLFARAFRGNAISEPEEETTILVYAQEVAPPYEVSDEKKVLDDDTVMDNRA